MANTKFTAEDCCVLKELSIRSLREGKDPPPGVRAFMEPKLDCTCVYCNGVILDDLIAPKEIQKHFHHLCMVSEVT